MKTFVKVVFILSMIFQTGGAFATNWENFQFVFNLGLVNGNYSNPIDESNTNAAAASTSSNLIAENGFSVAPSFNLQAEYFANLKSSYFVRAIIAVDSTEGKMRYNYLGLGGNRYFSSVGLMRSFVHKDVIVKTYPKWRHYYGWDLGFSRVIVVSFGPALNAVSTAIDFGAHLGTNYHLGKNWALNLQAGMSYAFGFTTVAVTGTNMKFFGGASFFF